MCAHAHTHRALFGHWEGNPNKIYFVSSGTGGPDEMLADIDDTQYMYGLGE